MSMKWYRNDHGPTPERREHAFKFAAERNAKHGATFSLAEKLAGHKALLDRERDAHMQTPEFWRQVWAEELKR